MHCVRSVARSRYPNQAVREEFRKKAVNSATNYFARLQKPSGHVFAGSFAYTLVEDDIHFYEYTQQFLEGVLLEVSSLTHQLIAGRPKRGSECPEDCEQHYPLCGLARSSASACALRHLSGTATTPPRVLRPIPSLSQRLRRGLMPSVKYAIEEARTYGAMPAGVRLRVPPDRRRQVPGVGDDFFSAAFGTDPATGARGPGGDGYTSLGVLSAKEYNQNYRSAHRYLAYRGHGDAPATAHGPPDEKEVRGNLTFSGQVTISWTVARPRTKSGITR